MMQMHPGELTDHGLVKPKPLIFYALNYRCRLTFPESLLSSLRANSPYSLPNKSCLFYLNKYVPITKWLPSYNFRADLSADIVAGFTVAIMHVPQVSYKLELSNIY